MTRREWLALVAAWTACAAASAYGQQGMASPERTPAPRAKPSGMPFNARFTDIAEQAGLRAPIIYGGVDRRITSLRASDAGSHFLITTTTAGSISSS
jgi:hypothetical protein